MTTLEKLTTAIIADRDREAAQIAMHNVIARALARFEDKPLTKRIERYIREILGYPAAVVSFDGDSIRIWNTPAFPSYADRATHYLPHPEVCRRVSGNADLRVKSFNENSDCCNGEAASRRNADRASLLADPHHLQVLAKAIDQHNTAFWNVSALTDSGIIGAPANYIARRMLEGTREYNEAQDAAREALRNKR
jgi:hypothetical protein